jgi:hypothetical protein
MSPLSNMLLLAKLPKISMARSLARVGQLTEDGHLGEELFVHLPLADGGAHEDAAVRVAVDAPQLDLRGRLDGGGARRPVDLHAQEK